MAAPYAPPPSIAPEPPPPRSPAASARHRPGEGRGGRSPRPPGRSGAERGGEGRAPPRPATERSTGCPRAPQPFSPAQRGGRSAAPRPRRRGPRPVPPPCAAAAWPQRSTRGTGQRRGDGGAPGASRPALWRRSGPAPRPRARAPASRNPTARPAAGPGERGRRGKEGLCEGRSRLPRYREAAGGLGGAGGGRCFPPALPAAGRGRLRTHAEPRRLAGAGGGSPGTRLRRLLVPGRAGAVGESRGGREPRAGWPGGPPPGPPPARSSLSPPREDCEA